MGTTIFLAATAVILFGTVLALHVTGVAPWRRHPDDAMPTRPAPAAQPLPAEEDSATTDGGPVRARAAETPAAPSPEPVTVERPEVTFADVAGLDDAIAELSEVREFLADPRRFRAVGADLPKGILLCGPPGNGKTLLARALAGEAGVAFHYVSASGFVEELVGRGAARIRNLFAEAKKDAPAIVFIDELDAVGRKRSGGGAGEREFEHTLNQLLVELDGFDASAGVLILAASNRPELLDQALVRPGRFDRRVQIERPDLAGREAILRLHAARRPFSNKVDWTAVAQQTAGLTGAELASTVNEAALLAARRHRRKIGGDDVDEAVSRLLSGPRSARLMSDEQKALAAYHASGHVLLALLVVGVSPPPRVSIVARAGALGRSPWMLQEVGVRTKRELIARLIVLLGGRAAELQVFGQPSTQAEDDLGAAAQMARRMVQQWAMTGGLELAGQDDHAVARASSGVRADGAVKTLLAQAEQSARAILADNPFRLHAVADALLRHESLTSGEVADLADLPPHGWTRPGRPRKEAGAVAPLTH